MSDLRGELDAALVAADADAARAVAHADAMRVLADLVWTIEGPLVDLDQAKARLKGAERARWSAAVDAASRSLPDEQ